MNTTVITKINNVEILASNVSEGLIPIRPICEALGVDYASQYTKLRDHVIYSPYIVLSTMVAADNKEREMVCIPIKFFAGWLFSINPANVKDEAKEALIKFQIECNNVLFDYFFGSQQKQLEQNAIEINLLEEIATIKQDIQNSKNMLNGKMKQLEKIRQDRLKNEPTLF